MVIPDIVGADEERAGPGEEWKIDVVVTDVVITDVAITEGFH